MGDDLPMNASKANLIHDEIMTHVVAVAKKHGCQLMTGTDVQYKGRIVMQELDSFPTGTKFKGKK